VIKIAVVEDQKIMRSFLEMLINSTPDITIIWSVESPEIFMQDHEQYGFHVALVDYTFPGSSLNGLEVCRRLKKESPTKRSIIMTGHEDAWIAEDAMAVADGFISKTTGDINEIAQAIRRVMTGKRHLTGDVARRLDGVEPPREGLAILSRKERVVLSLLIRGDRNKDVAEHLAISEKTVSQHKTNALAKLGVSSLMDAAAMATSRGWRI